MMDIARDQSTKIVGIFPRSSTATVMQKEPHAVHVFEDSGTLRPGRLSRQLARLDLFGAAIRIEPRQLRRSEEHTSELQSQSNLVCRLLLEKKKTTHQPI